MYAGGRMEIFHLLRSHPLNGMALVVSIAVMVWCLFMVRRVQTRTDRMLTGLIGLTAVFHSLRLLAGSGFFLQTSRPTLDDIFNIFFTAISPAVLWYLKKVSSEYLAMRFAVRLAESDQSTPPYFGRIQHGVIQRRPFTEPSNSLFDAMPMAMFAVSLDGNVSCWNRAAEKTLGWSRDEVLGHKLPNMVLEPQADGNMGCIRLLRKNGEPVQSEFRSVPIRDARGSVNGILTIVQA